MITELVRIAVRLEEPSELSPRKRKNVAGARFTNKFGPDNQTHPLREPLRLRFDDCWSEDRNQSVAQAKACVARSSGTTHDGQYATLQRRRSNFQNQHPRNLLR